MNTIEKKVTCVIPTYRRPESLRLAILSVLRQNYEALKVSVFDDASGDQTKDVVKRLAEKDSRVSYYCHSCNIGSEPNFKYAIESVDTPYFSILSDDDMLSKTFYEKAVSILDKNSDIMFVISNTLIINTERDLVQVQNSKSDGSVTFYRNEDRFNAFHLGVFPSWNGILFRKKVAETYSAMSHNNDLAHDHKFLVRAAARYNFAHLADVGAFFTNHIDSFSSNWKDFDMVRFYSKIIKYVEVSYDKQVPVIIQKQARIYLHDIATSNPYKGWLLRSLKRFIGRCCNNHQTSINIVNADIRNSYMAGYIYTSKILEFANSNHLIISFLRALFYKTYINKKKLEQKMLTGLQTNIYSDVISDIKMIN